MIVFKQLILQANKQTNKQHMRAFQDHFQQQISHNQLMESIERDSFVHNKSWGVGWSSVAHGFFDGKSTVIQ